MSTLRQQLLASSLLLTLATTSSGKPADARLVKDLDRRVAPGSISWIESTPNGVIFSMNSRKYGRELWVSDNKGTRLLKDIYPGAWGSAPYPVLVRDGIVYLTCLDKEYGKEIWVTDGTREGTRLHSDIRPGVTSSDTTVLLENQGKLFLSGLTPHGFGLFTADSDGTVSPLLVTVPIEPTAHSLPYLHFRQELSFILGDRAYFIDDHRQCWETDGTPEGTNKITDFTLPEGKHPSSVVVASGKAILRLSNNGSGAAELWTWSPGGAEPELLMSLPVIDHTAAETLAFGGKLMIVTPRTIHISDGTPEGTVLIKSFAEGSLVRYIGKKGDDALLQVSEENSFDFELWKTDGTEQGTLPIKAFNGFTETTRLWNFTNAEDRAYFKIGPEGYTREAKSSLWFTDGTEAGTAEVKPGARFGSSIQMVALGNRLYFPSADQLWRTNGTPKSTKPVLRVSGTNLSFFEFAEPGGILATDRRLFLFSSSFEEEPEGIVAVSGGTAASTRPFWSKQNSYVFGGAVLGSKVLFEDSTGIHITDGTARGTRRIFDLDHSVSVDIPGFRDALTIGSTCFMLGYKADGGATLWKTDGTTEGTAQIQAEEDPLEAHTLTEFRGSAYYLSSNNNLWASDGTDAGTRMIASNWAGSGPYQLVNSGSRLYFFTTQGPSDTEGLNKIWTSEGTTAGSRIVGTIHGKIGMQAALNGELIFSLSSGKEPWELYRANEAGITKYATLPEGFQIEEGARTRYRSLAVAGGNLYFKCGKPSNIVEDPQYPLWGELWKTDGTAAGTRMVKDIAEGEAGSSPQEMIAAGDDIYFAASIPGESLKIWKSDGTEEGTVMIQSKDSEPIFMSDLTLFKSKLFFTAYSPKTGVELHSLALPKAKKKKK